MFTFNEERLAYLLSKLQAEINKKVDKDKYVKDASKNATFEMKRKSLEKLIEKMIRKENLSNE